MTPEPYSAILAGIKARIVDATGPFTSAEQIEYWPDDGSESEAPSDELLTALTQLGRNPCCLLSDGGSSTGDEPGDGGWSEDWQIVLRYAVQAPTNEIALLGNAEYWGEVDVRNWLLNRLSMYGLPTGVGAYAVTLYTEGRSTLATRKKGVLACALRFTVRQIVYDPAS